jgi:hypothetical protein
MPAQLLRVPFRMQATLASIRSRTGHFAQSTTNGFLVASAFSGDRDPSYFSLRFFFQLQYDEEFAPY